MEPIRVRCRSCNKEVEGVSGKSVCCGCSNLATIQAINPKVFLVVKNWIGKSKEIDAEFVNWTLKSGSINNKKVY